MKKLHAQLALLAMVVALGAMQPAQAEPGLGVLTAVIFMDGATVIGGGEPDGWQTSEIGGTNSKEWHTDEAVVVSTGVVNVECADGSASVTVSGFTVNGSSADFTVDGLISDGTVYAGTDDEVTISVANTEMKMVAAGTCDGATGVIAGAEAAGV